MSSHLTCPEPTKAERILLAMEIAVVFGAGLIVRSLLHGGRPDRIEAWPLLFGLLGWAVPMTALLALLARLRGETLADLGLMTPRRIGRSLAVGIVGGVGLAFGAGWLGWLVGGLLGVPGLEASFRVTGTGTWFVFVLCALVAGSFEELLFRGYLLQRFARLFARHGRPALGTAVVITSAWFGLEHAYQGAAGIVVSGFMGAYLAALVALARGNLWPAIIAHATNDILAYSAMATSS
jgi:membrane protease YdiL (CAAX protease family)